MNKSFVEFQNVFAGFHKADDQSGVNFVALKTEDSFHREVVFCLLKSCFTKK